MHDICLDLVLSFVLVGSWISVFCFFGIEKAFFFWEKGEGLSLFSNSRFCEGVFCFLILGRRDRKGK